MIEVLAQASEQATGITGSDVLKGISINDNIYTSETLVTHKSLDYREILKKDNFINE